MYRANTSHLQGNLFSTLDELPSGVREILETSWAGTFRHEVFGRLDEEPFAVLYSTTGSRPNVPVNVLVGLEILKSGFGWSDEEMYHEFLLNLQVRYALGYENLGDGYFAIRTVYNFRNALSEHMQKSGENLLDVAFRQVTDEQLSAFALATGKQRMDSTQIASDIRQYSQLQLLVEVLQRVNRMLTSDDQSRYGLLLAPYIKGKSGHYVYRLQGGEYKKHLAQIGPLMDQLITELASEYADDPIYQMLVRVFGEQFILEYDEVQLLPGKMVAATSLQSPDDPEATFRTKNGKSYRGYVVNVTETCDPDNDFQLVVKTQTESNVTDDAAMLVEALPELVERTELDTLSTDGGYNSPEVDPLLDEYSIDHIQTAIRGGKPDPTQVSLSDFTFDFNHDDEPIQATCSQGQTFPIELGRTEGRYIGRPDTEVCNTCLFFARCQVRPRQGNHAPTLYFNQRELLLARKRQDLDALPDHLRNLRPPVESTVRSIKHPFRHGRVLLRGKFRVASAITASAFMVNVRRIHLVLKRKRPAAAPALQLPVNHSLQPHFPAFLCFLLLSYSFRQLRRCNIVLSCNNWPHSLPIFLCPVPSTLSSHT